MNLRVLSILLLLSTASCRTVSDELPVAAGVTLREYEFINTILATNDVLIENAHPVDVPEKKPEKPSWRRFISKEELKEHFQDLTDDTVDDLAEKNYWPHTFSDDPGHKLTPQLMSKDRLDEFFSSFGSDIFKAWEAFSKEFKGAGDYTRISRPGFNKTGNQALVYFEYTCGITCGGTDYRFYVKEGEGWVEKGKYNMWMS